jgi:hypothetical protein
MARQASASNADDAIDPVCLENIGLFPFFGCSFRFRRFASGPKGLFFPFPPSAELFLSFTHGLALLSPY